MLLRNGRKVSPAIFEKSLSLIRLQIPTPNCDCSDSWLDPITDPIITHFDIFD